MHKMYKCFYTCTLYYAFLPHESLVLFASVLHFKSLFFILFLDFTIILFSSSDNVSDWTHCLHIGIVDCWSPVDSHLYDTPYLWLKLESPFQQVYSITSLSSDWLRLLSRSIFNPSPLVIVLLVAFRMMTASLSLGYVAGVVGFLFLHNWLLFVGTWLIFSNGFRGSLFVLLVVDICSLPLEKGRWNIPKHTKLCDKSSLISVLSHPGSNPSTQYRITNVNTADNLASNPRGTLANLTPGLVPYSPQYRGVLVPAYVSSSVSQPTQAGGYTAGSTLTGCTVQPAAYNQWNISWV